MVARLKMRGDRVGAGNSGTNDWCEACGGSRPDACFGGAYSYSTAVVTHGIGTGADAAAYAHTVGAGNACIHVHYGSAAARAGDARIHIHYSRTADSDTEA